MRVVQNFITQAKSKEFLNLINIQENVCSVLITTPLVGVRGVVIGKLWPKYFFLITTPLVGY